MSYYYLLRVTFHIILYRFSDVLSIFFDIFQYDIHDCVVMICQAYGLDKKIPKAFAFGIFGLMLKKKMPLRFII